MEHTKTTETLTEKFERITRDYTEMRFVAKMSGLEFYSEPVSRERMLDRWSIYGRHPSSSIVGLHRIEGRTGVGEWETV